MILTLTIITLCFACSSAVPNYGGGNGTSAPTPSQHFDNRFALNVEKSVWLFWSANDTDKSIVFEIHAKTHGYVGFGLSPNGKMYPSDVVVGWVKDGQTYFKDYHTVGHSHPVIDQSQDWFLLSGSEKDEWTILKFWRKLDTCDGDDIAIGEDTIRVIYSFNDLDPNSYTGLSYHGATHRGTQSLMLLSASLNEDDIAIPDDVITYNLLNENFHVPSADTTYWCRTFRLPNLGRKHHLIKAEHMVMNGYTVVGGGLKVSCPRKHRAALAIGAKMFGPVVTTGNELNVHHILVYACPPGTHVDARFDDMSYNCEEQNYPELGNCKSAVLLAWAIGGTDYYFPEIAGISLGTQLDPDFFIMETHYDNPNMKSDIVDNSGLRVYLTPTLRQHDAGVLQIGMGVNKLQIVPPFESRFESKGFCLREHLEQSLPPEGVNVFGTIQHAHLLGVGIKTRLFRHGIEEKPLSDDENYDFNFQNIRSLRPMRKMMRGDSLEVVCKLDSSKKTRLTYGGLTTHEEMCLSFIFYYPRMSLGYCNSSPKYEAVAHNPEKAVEIFSGWNWNNATTRYQFQQILNTTAHYHTAMFLDRNQPWDTIIGKEVAHIREYTRKKACH